MPSTPDVYWPKVRVARLAGVSKSTVYKWWPSKGALALDGYFRAVEPALAFPDTGDIRADLISQLRLACERMEKAQHDGQIRPEVDVRVLVDQLGGAAYHRILIPDEPVTAEFVVALVTNLMDGIAPR